MVALFKEGRFAENRIIKGEDILTIIKDTGVPIRVRDSLIVNGLDFTTLPSTPLADIKLPEQWTPEEHNYWESLKRLDDVQAVYVVENPIQIINSTILHHPYDRYAPPPPIDKWAERPSMKTSLLKDRFSVKAPAAFFANVDFQGTVFTEGVVFDYATFREAAFYTVLFEGDASFYSTTVDGNAEFRSTTFRKSVNFDYSGPIGSHRGQVPSGSDLTC